MSEVSQYSPNVRKGVGEMREISESATLPEIIESLNDIIGYWNVYFRKLSMRNNFDCQLLNVEFDASATVRIPHKLGVKPNHRLILNQSGNGLLTDVASEWTDTYVTMVNNGAVTVNAVIMLIKD